jgi:hypothetical protein
MNADCYEELFMKLFEMGANERKEDVNSWYGWELNLGLFRVVPKCAIPHPYLIEYVPPCCE